MFFISLTFSASFVLPFSSWKHTKPTIAKPYNWLINFTLVCTVPFARYEVPSRPWLRGHVLEASEAQKRKLKDRLQDLPADRTVTITLDLWSSRSLLSYLGMTVHFVESERLQAELLAFRWGHLPCDLPDLLFYFPFSFFFLSLSLSLSLCLCLSVSLSLSISQIIHWTMIIAKWWPKVLTKTPFDHYEVDISYLFTVLCSDFLLLC